MPRCGPLSEMYVCSLGHSGFSSSCASAARQITAPKECPTKDSRASVELMPSWSMNARTSRARFAPSVSKEAEAVWSSLHDDRRYRADALSGWRRASWFLIPRRSKELP